MDSTKNILVQEGLAFVYGPTDILINMALAFGLGLIISYIYKVTHKGLSYSQSFMLTIVFVTFIVAVVMMVIGNNLARAFALVGALSIIRFRTVIKDTKDTAYIFLGLAAGMAAGTSSYFLAIAGVGFFSLISLVLNATNYGSFYKSEFLLRFRTFLGEREPEYSSVINEFARSSNLLHIEPSGDGKTAKLTFDILLRKEKKPEDLSRRIAEIESLSEVVLVASKHDVDY
ncbi:MAG: DUF4956 domain-containing protein [Nitrospina sp.]|jgi:uncharacterized membrane protein YhiD involved in acid resistance|nr:DUF4956 domain-containing protein [Nitrospina sp.]